MVYNRFRKSKDLNMYSTDDLSAILGHADKRPRRLLAEDDDGDKAKVGTELTCATWSRAAAGDIQAL